MHFDTVIVGGGILGLSVARELLIRHPSRRVAVVEKEATPGKHQTGRNSGVLHTGVYYRPGSLKARLCARGRVRMQRFCDDRGIAWEQVGKVIVATNAVEVERLDELWRRAAANDVRVERIDRGRLAELEPHAAGDAALWVPDAGIVDYGAVCDALLEEIDQRGGTLLTSWPVDRIDEGSEGGVARVTGPRGALEADRVIACAGLWSDRLARRSGRRSALRIVPFRGEYYRLRPEAEHLCRGLIYPVPDPSFPFLGVHFTRKVGGGVECGPNAVLAYAREGYRHRDVVPAELAESLFWPGFQRLALRHWRTGAGELWRSLSRRAFAASLQRLVPDVREQDLIPAPAGVRAQALDRDGNLVDDFVIVHEGRVAHICNAPSPAATSSLAIAEWIVDRVA